MFIIQLGDQNKYDKRKFAINTKKTLLEASKHVKGINFADLHELLKAYTDIFTQNVYVTKDFTYKNLKNAIMAVSYKKLQVRKINVL